MFVIFSAAFTMHGANGTRTKTIQQHVKQERFTMIEHPHHIDIVVSCVMCLCVVLWWSSCVYACMQAEEKERCSWFIIMLDVYHYHLDFDQIREMQRIIGGTEHAAAAHNYNQSCIVLDSILLHSSFSTLFCFIINPWKKGEIKSEEKLATNEKVQKKRQKNQWQLR